MAIPEAWLDILDESIKHRGPDGHGRFRDRAVRADGSVVDVAFVHRRLAIIDPTDGHQPMVSERGRNEGEGLVAVVFNGCIYNHRELRRELERAGHRFETDHSDTEVLVHGWREWRDRLPGRLDGMFAFAIWDRGRQIIFTARDQFGERPFYYVAQTANPLYHPDSYPEDSRAFVAFASAPAGLYRVASKCSFGHKLPDIRETLTAWVADGFAAECPVAGVRQLGASACFTTWRHGGETSGYRPDGNITARAFATEPSPRGGMTVSDVERTLRRAVASRLETDVPLGCLLSGGVDSSLVAVFAKQHLDELRTYTVAMPDRQIDESEHAQRVAGMLGTRHSNLQCDPRPSHDLVELITRLGLPFGDSSLLPTHWVSRAARREVTVALTGDGADELFFGYRRYVAARLMRRYGLILRRIPLPLIRGAGADSLRGRLHRMSEAAQANGYSDLRAIFPQPLLSQLMPNSPPRLRDDVGDAHSPEEAASRARRFDVGTYLPDDILRKTDTAAMAVALETRAPFLEPELATAALVAGPAALMPRGQRKGLLRQVARKYLPAEIVDRPKQGFAIPIGEWFRTDYGGMKQLLMDHLNSTEPWGPPSLGIDLNMTFVRRMLDEHMSERRDHSQRLYMLLVLSIWAKWLGGL